MTLRTLLDGVTWQTWTGPQDTPVTGLSCRAEEVAPGHAFCTWRGNTADGHDHIPQALQRGATALVVERPVPAGPSIPVVCVTSGRRALARMAANLHGHPAQALRLIGVTGTNGKTSTVFLLHHILQSTGTPCGLIGTIRHQSGQRILPSTHTTPDSLRLHALLAEMRRDGCTAATMEVSSHALDQDRVHGLRFHVAVFTNLTQDHLDYHQTMENYFQAKARLFTGLEAGTTAVLNLADPAGRRLLTLLPAGVQAAGYSTDPAHPAPARAENLRCTSRGLSFDWHYPGGAHPLQAPWLGNFNAANILAAAEAARSLGMDPVAIARAIASAPAVPGRMEIVPWNGPFTVVVDYAHTDDALRNVLTTLRPLTHGRLRVLIGCGGNRDRGKRPLMACAACELADEAFFTADNPRDEDPLAILQDMEAGIPAGIHVRIIPDRAEAIATLIQTARPGDVLLLAGKGHETTQEIRGVKTPFSDREHAARALAAWQEASS